MRIKSAASLALAAVLGGALLAGSAGPAAAQGWLERLQTKLELSDDQAKAIKDIYARDAESQRQIIQALRQAQGDLGRLALNSADPTAIQQKAAEVEGLLAQSLQLRVRRLQEIAPLLTPEQRERLAQFSAGPPWMRRGQHAHPPRGIAS